LSFTLPSDWAGARGSVSGSGPRFEGDGPSRIATLSIYTAKSAPLSVVAPRIETIVRQQFVKADPHATFAARHTTVGSSLAALQMTVHYHGVWTGGVGDLTHVIYVFVHGGVLFDFDYMAVAPHTAKYLSVFTGSAASIRFL
jgi:hypothetical protein